MLEAIEAKDDCLNEDTQVRLEFGVVEGGSVWKAQDVVSAVQQTCRPEEVSLADFCKNSILTVVQIEIPQVPYHSAGNKAFLRLK